jgi:hypothetical protein
MGIRTLIGYLLGKRDAILQLAANPWALPIGLVFVVSAGFAREYDGEDLLHEPWHLVLPLAASLGSSLVLFFLAYVGPCGEGSPGFFSAYRSFLGLFWMTAPLAWLYAIPYERFLAPGEAMEANLWTLGLVASWRVLLMIRVLVVLLDYTLLAALFLVMTYADALVLMALQSVPVSILSVMGGVRLSERDRVLAMATFNIGFLGICSGPLWVMGLAATRFTTRPQWLAPPPAAAVSPPALSLWALALGALVGGAMILPYTQPEQQRRHRVEHALRAGHLREALEEMSAHELDDYPPHWQPPGRWYAASSMKDRQLVRAVWAEILETAPAPWVRQRFLTLLAEQLDFVYLRDEEIDELGSLLQRSPEGPELLREVEEKHRPYRLSTLERLQRFLKPSTPGVNGEDEKGRPGDGK